MKNSNTFIPSTLVFACALFLAPITIFAQENTAAPVIKQEMAAPVEQQQPANPIILPVERPSPPPEQPGEPQPMPPKETPKAELREEEDRKEYVDPREIRDVLRQIRDLKREANRIIKMAVKAKLTAEADQVRAILAQVATFEAALKAPVDSISRDTLQDFYELQPWDTLNDIRVKIELPKELAQIERELKKLEKMVSRKSFAVEGVAMEVILAKIAEIKGAVSSARQQLAQNNLEDAREAMQVVYEDGAHPGEMMGVLNRLSEMTRRLKRIKSEAVKNEIREVLAPVYEAVNSGDFREANMLLNDSERELWKVMDAVRTKSDVGSEMRKRLQQLEERLQQKSQQEEKPEKQGSIMESRQAYYDYKNYSASLWEKFMDWIYSWQ